VIFWYGSGSGSLDRSVHLISNPDPDPALFVSDIQDANKKYLFFPFCFAYYGTSCRYPTFISVFEDKKNYKKSQNSTVEIKVFLICLLDDRKIRIRTFYLRICIRGAERIQNRNSMVRIRGPGFLSKHHESGTLITTYVQTVLV
jgi:hypothetical protein